MKLKDAYICIDCEELVDVIGVYFVTIEYCPKCGSAELYPLARFLNREEVEKMSRLNVPITDDLDRELNGIMPWGLKAAVFRKLAEQLVVAVKRDGFSVVDLILSDRYDLIKGERK